MKKTILALIGAGKWGQNYLHTAATLNNIKIKYICTQSQQTWKLLPNTYIKTTSIDELLENEDIDGYIIASPTITHFTIAKQLLTAGYNLLIEKPLTVNYNQALELEKIWQIKKPKVLVGHLYLYNPAYQAFKQILKRIKKVKYIAFEGLGSTARKDVSVIWDWGPHPISILIDLVKQEIIKITATGSINSSDSNLYDTVRATIQFNNGLKALISISWIGSSKTRKLIAKGEGELLELNDATIYQKVSFTQPNSSIIYPPYNSDAPLTKELQEFIAAIQGSKKITSNISTAVKVTRILSAIEQSIQNKGKPILLD